MKTNMTTNMTTNSLPSSPQEDTLAQELKQHAMMDEATASAEIAMEDTRASDAFDVPSPAVREALETNEDMEQGERNRIISQIREEEREKLLKKIAPCLEYCREQNGRNYCKNCGLDADLLK